jgi:hypothetical protein
MGKGSGMEETTCTSGNLWVEKRHNESRGRVGLTANDTTGAIRKPGKQNERVFMVDGGWETEVKNPMLACVDICVSMVQI